MISTNILSEIGTMTRRTCFFDIIGGNVVGVRVRVGIGIVRHSVELILLFDEADELVFEILKQRTKQDVQ